DPQGPRQTGQIIWTETNEYGYRADTADEVEVEADKEKWVKVKPEVTKDVYTEATSSTDDADSPIVPATGFVSDEIKNYGTSGDTGVLTPFTLYAPGDENFQLEIAIRINGGNENVVKTLKKGTTDTTYIFNPADYSLNSRSDTVTILARLIGEDSDKTDSEHKTTEVSSAEVLSLTVSGMDSFGQYYINGTTPQTPKITTKTWNKTTEYQYRKSTGAPEMKTNIVEYTGTFEEKTTVAKYKITADTQEWQLVRPGEEEDVRRKSIELKEWATALLRFVYYTGDLKWKLRLDLEAGFALAQQFNALVGEYSPRIVNYVENMGLLDSKYRWGSILGLDFTADHKVFKAGEVNIGADYKRNTLDDIDRLALSFGYTQRFDWLLSGVEASGSVGYDFNNSNGFFSGTLGLGFWGGRIWLDSTLGVRIDESSKFGDKFNWAERLSFSVIKTKQVDFTIQGGINGLLLDGGQRFQAKPTAGAFITIYPDLPKK
ncbi:MAG: hypothetical protein LBJ25_02185, partial [Candidatus Margulisbacteria bacterium]|nr:hypothetical protein [Candidatus Margulisiibacteriota bacterium]